MVALIIFCLRQNLRMHISGSLVFPLKHNCTADRSKQKKKTQISVIYTFQIDTKAKCFMLYATIRQLLSSEKDQSADNSKSQCVQCVRTNFDRLFSDLDSRLTLSISLSECLFLCLNYSTLFSDGINSSVCRSAPKEKRFRKTMRCRFEAIFGKFWQKTIFPCLS